MEVKQPKEQATPSVSTKLIRHGESFANSTGTVMPPIYQTATFSHGNQEGFDYTRSGNPNFRILESVLCSLENCNYSTVFGSGVSAITAIASSLKSGDLVLCEENLYGCTVRLFEQVFKKFGLKTKWLDFSKISSIDLINDLAPSMIWLESPTNPLLKVLDLKKICTKAKECQIPVVVDNTFATALLQKPLELGATISLTSTTKYINGHSDALGGAICTQDITWNEKMKFAQKALGLQPSPFDCWLITRGIKTLPLRLKKQVDNALQLANELSKHSCVQSVRYPFHSDHPQNKLAQKQMTGGGAIITINLKANQKQAYSFCKGLKYFTMAESLGGIESLICHPSTMTHASVPSHIKQNLGIDDGLVRLSIGCEDFFDLDQDVKQSLDKLR